LLVSSFTSGYVAWKFIGFFSLSAEKWVKCNYGNIFLGHGSVFTVHIES